MTNEDKEIVADYMGYLTHPMGSWYDAPVYFAAGKAGNINFDLNDAELVVAEMQKRGELYIFLTWIDNNLPYKEWSNFIAWIFNPDNFFSAFVEWRKLEAIKRAEGSIPPFNHKHCFDSDGKCSCGLLEEFYDEGEGK